MKFIVEYNTFLINEQFEFDVVKSFLGVATASLLGAIIYAIIHQFKLTMGKKIVGDFDPVLKNKMDQYENALEGKLSKLEIYKIFKIFYSDNVLKGYLKKIADSNNEDEKRFLHQQADEYIKTKLPPSMLKTLNSISYRGDVNYKVTPNIVNEFDGIMKEFLTEFNTYLSSKNMPPIERHDIVGSSFYWKDDIKNNSDKIYGDIDCILVYPLLDFGDGNRSRNIDEEKTADLYNNLLLKFVDENAPNNIDKRLTFNLNRSKFNKKLFNGISLPVIVDNGKILNVDLLPTFSPYRSWAMARLTPEKDFKGSLFGYMYHALGEVLNIDINRNGVTTWITPVKGKLKGRRDTGAKIINNVSHNYQTFLLDVTNFFISLIKDDNSPYIHKLLKDNPGIDPENVDLETLFKGIKGLVSTLEYHKFFSKNILPDVINGDDCLDRIKKIYMNDLFKALHNPKYNNIKSDPLLKLDFEKVKKSTERAEELTKKWLS